MFALIGNFGPWEIAFVLLVVLIIFGPGKLPKAAEAIGKTFKSLRKAVNEKEEKTGDDAFYQDDSKKN